MEYIKNAVLEDALCKLPLHPFTKTEILAVTESLGRISAQAVFAEKSSPHYNGAAMDGIAVRAEETKDARMSEPLILDVGTFQYVNTGAPISSPYDSVIMIEDVIGKHTDQVLITAPAVPWQHIRQLGEDIVKGEMILRHHAKIRPVDIAALLAGGITELSVLKKPKVAILPTGAEITRKVRDVKKGEITDTNSPMLRGLIAELGAEVRVHEIVEDDPVSLRQAAAILLEQADMLLVLAGSSAGSKDFTHAFLSALGADILEHGIAIKPGKPTLLATLGEKVILGLPGYPVSCYLSFQLFAKPVLEAWTAQPSEPRTVQARLSQDLLSSFKHQEYVRVSLGYIQDELYATPLQGGAGSIMSLARCDGLAVIPRQVEWLPKDAAVEVTLLRELSEVAHKLIITGSHDITLDLLADHMAIQSSHVGSFGGLLALKDRRCHVAPIHLIAEDGTYNVPFVRQLFSEEDMTLIKGFKRALGLAVAKGNPQEVHGLQDLTRLRFVNRQRGAGTRVLLDKLLKEHKIGNEEIEGYDHERPTHMAVCTTIAEGLADVGLASYSAALACGLDFIRIADEQYDFLLYTEDLQDERVIRLLRLLETPSVRRSIEALGGYELYDRVEMVKP